MGIASKGPRIVLRELRRGCTVSGQERDETRVLRPRAQGLCYGNLDEDARFWDGRSVLANGRGDLGAGRPRPRARGEVTSVETVLAYDRDLIQTDPLLDITRIDRELVFQELSGIDSVVTGFDPNKGAGSSGMAHG
ncbi:hypothetical protein F2Q68_00010852 [Brassica cretica]|uniref:Uncharacterized protein n=1 Tax=Brassica cretica TaxID=69181 RepID=A0A8S9KNW6_BRACR|nr:hypothetical protein F2Q68_00010852 [Brassica cretica]